MAYRPVGLLILDGFGLSAEKEGNAVALAKTPHLDALSRGYRGTALQASGIEVGLPWGEMGSSEVGHTNLGAGTVVYQSLPRIDRAVEDGSFFALPAWKSAADHAREHRGAIHLTGLVSNGGIHSAISHLFAALDALRKLQFDGEVLVHMITDGQDTAPKSAEKFLAMLREKIAPMKNVSVATVMGRYYAMDKNENWSRTEQAYLCLTRGEGNPVASAEQAIADGYAAGLTDETLKPSVVIRDGQPIRRIQAGDAVIFFNFRADRMRQLTAAFADPAFSHFKCSFIPDLQLMSLTDYGIASDRLLPVFAPQIITHPLARVLADAGKTQFHIAEKEKYAHVTYFFNGGIEKAFPGEDRVIIESPQVKTYASAPKMSAEAIVARVTAELEKRKYDFFVINLANGDLVGHTGNLQAGIWAVEELDACIGKLAEAFLGMNGVLCVTGDHGNVEEMINLETKEIDKEHSVDPVPFWIIGKEYALPPQASEASPGSYEPRGILADVAPTLLDIMHIEKPKEMTGSSLLGEMGQCVLPK
ncbi:MAG: 2,3-bisphosphoglycerate-independent phosphoglycerate mutase [Patescibacteria group bacterium]|nr:2,3-bisphosphoglycerate-independent phosphoglycerate mutase [Patescibacteria group bacterium]